MDLRRHRWQMSVSFNCHGWLKMFFLASVVLPQVIFISAMSFNCKKNLFSDEKSSFTLRYQQKLASLSNPGEVLQVTTSLDKEKEAMLERQQVPKKGFLAKLRQPRIVPRRNYIVFMCCHHRQMVALMPKTQCFFYPGPVYTVKSYTHLTVFLQTKSILLDPGFGSGGHWPPFCQLNSSRWFKGHFAHVWRYHNVSSVVVTRDDEVIYSPYCQRRQCLWWIEWQHAELGRPRPTCV